MTDCLFCGIAEKTIPATILFEDDVVVAFLDIHPISAGHTLVIPKRHSANVLDVDAHDAAELFRRMPKIVRAVQAAVRAEGCNVNINSGEVAGQVVPHLHVHIIPRSKTDGFRQWQHRAYASGEAETVAAAIRSSFQEDAP